MIFLSGGLPMFDSFDTFRGRGPRSANRVIRGGSWNNNARNVRAAYRNHNDPSNRNNNLGFRFVLVQAPAGWSVPDQVCVLSSDPCVLAVVRGKHPCGRRCAGRTVETVAKAHRRLVLSWGNS